MRKIKRAAAATLAAIMAASISMGTTEAWARSSKRAAWNNTVEANPDLSFILSAGDQINQTNVSKTSEKLEQQVEYSGFLNPSVLRSIPVATTIGNHDSKSVNYSNHFNYPNKQTSAENTASMSTA